MSQPRTIVIAEAGVNHNGSLDMALALVDAAAEAGADIVKFQTFKASKLASSRSVKAQYQQRTTGAEEGQLAMLSRLELDEDAHHALIARCEARGIEFLSSPFDHDSLDLLTGILDLPRIKLGSGELTNGPLLLAAARTGKPIILSTGMATLEEVATALAVLAHGYSGQDGPPPAAPAKAGSVPGLWGRVSLLHCTTEYPAPMADVNLRAMDTLREAFGLETGYSDHTTGIHVSVAAVARGATIIEKHFTLDRTLPGPDHPASLEPRELAAMVAAIRDVERAIGDGVKGPTEIERGNMPIARKSLIAARPIAAGELLSADNLTVKRPGTGRSPMLYWQTLGERAARAYGADEPIDP